MTDPLAELARLEGVPSAYAAARDGVDTLLRDRGLRKTAPGVTAESLLRGAHASAVLEGSGSSLDDVREGRGDEIAADAVRLSTELLGLAPLLSQAPLQAFARMHALAARSALPADELGRPRDAESAARLREISSMITASTTVPGMITAAVVHAELASAQAFASHNGLVARAAERLVLLARGVDEKSLTVPEAGHLAFRAQYESNLRGYASATRAGMHAWLLYAAESFAKGTEASPLHEL